MIDPRDLPFDISDTPDLYTTFRKVRISFKRATFHNQKADLG
jgi:hypothetical protein